MASVRPDCVITNLIKYVYKKFPKGYAYNISQHEHNFAGPTIKQF